MYQQTRDTYYDKGQVWDIEEKNMLKVHLNSILSRLVILTYFSLFRWKRSFLVAHSLYLTHSVKDCGSQWKVTSYQ